MALMGLKAQRQILVFHNDSAKKAVQLVEGGMLMVQYNGYLGQTELNTNTIVELNDSLLILGKPRLLGKPLERREIRLNDITGFRKISAGSQLLKFALSTGATLGAYYTFSDNQNLTSTEKLLFSTATGLATHFTIKLAFPGKKIKYKLKDGWKITIL
jgi:hypothetical protein